MADDNRFDGYTPAPLQQSGLDRTVRTAAGAVEGGVKYGLGAWAIGIATAVGLGLYAAFAVFPLIGGAGLLAWTGSIAVGGAVTAIGLIGNNTIALLSGLYGAARGGSREHARSGLDNSIYNIATAQQMAYQQAAPIYYAPPPQGMTPPSPVMQPAAPVARDDMPPAVAANLAQNTVAGSPIRNDGTVVERNLSRASG